MGDQRRFPDPFDDEGPDGPDGPARSCEGCGGNLYEDDDPEVCDQCLFYRVLGGES